MRTGVKKRGYVSVLRKRPGRTAMELATTPMTVDKQVKRHPIVQEMQEHLQILRRSRRPLLQRLEQAGRSALVHHVHWTAPMGARVLINGNWYDRQKRRRRETTTKRSQRREHYQLPHPLGPPTGYFRLA